MLVIAVNLEHLQDPEHDLEFLQGMIKQSKINNIHFEGLPGGKATLSKIKKRIRFLYRKARETSGYSNLLILFTGLGDTKNRMRLHNREVMTVKALKRWLLRLRAESTTTQPVTLVFDICRWTKGKKCTKMHKDVSLIWSCAPGQGAHALRFKSRNDIPRSCFLIAFLMSSCDSPTSRSFEDAMGQRMGQLVAFLKYVYKAGHVETCKNCQSQRPCDNTEDPELSSQNPDWEQAGVSNICYHSIPFTDSSLPQQDTFFKLAGLLSRHYPEPAQRVYRLFMGNSIFCKAVRDLLCISPIRRRADPASLRTIFPLPLQLNPSPITLPRSPIIRPGINEAPTSLYICCRTRTRLRSTLRWFGDTPAAHHNSTSQRQFHNYIPHL
jgi:hypothetical protein